MAGNGRAVRPAGAALAAKLAAAGLELLRVNRPASIRVEKVECLTDLFDLGCFISRRAELLIRKDDDTLDHRSDLSPLGNVECARIRGQLEIFMRVLVHIELLCDLDGAVTELR